MAKLTKKQKSLETQVDREKLYGVDEAIASPSRSPPPSSTNRSKWR